MQNGLLFGRAASVVFVDLNVIRFIVVNIDQSLSDKEHFFNICLVTNHNFSWNIDSAEHVNDQIICETTLAFFKEMVK